MAFPRPDDYKTYEGPSGSPSEWSRKAKRLGNAVHTLDSKTLKSLQALGLEELPKTHALLKRAYKRAALKAHPDQGGSNEDFLEVQAAYEALRKD